MTDKSKCTCVYATAANTRSVRLGYEMGGYLKKECDHCKLAHLEYELQLADNRNAVWIHASDGSTVGRFGVKGVDLHTTVTEQLNGASQCRLCTHGEATIEDWQLFRDKALEWWGVEVPEDAFDVKLLSVNKREK